MYLCVYDLGINPSFTAPWSNYCPQCNTKQHITNNQKFNINRLISRLILAAYQMTIKFITNTQKV